MHTHQEPGNEHNQTEGYRNAITVTDGDTLQAGAQTTRHCFVGAQDVEITLYDRRRDWLGLE